MFPLNFLMVPCVYHSTTLAYFYYWRRVQDSNLCTHFCVERLAISWATTTPTLRIWRGERDLNPRAPFRANGFQDRPSQPLWYLPINLNDTCSVHFHPLSSTNILYAIIISHRKGIVKYFFTHVVFLWKECQLRVVFLFHHYCTPLKNILLLC